MVKTLTRITQVSLFVLLVGAAAFGQGTTGSILGTVFDQSQAVLPGVTITAVDRDTGLKREALTDEQGRFVMAQMKIGRYLVEADLSGFRKASREITLTLEGDSVVNFTLAVGAAQTEVMVTSEAPLVETASSSIKGLVDQQQIRDLPLNGRSFADLAALQTGVAVNYNQQSTSGNEGVKMSVAGARSTNTGYQLDGTEIRNQMGTTPGSLAGVLLGVDTVQEFSVITGVANAEYGGFSGGVINAVTRSGTNAFHGSIFEFLRNSALDARNFFDRDPANPTRRSTPPPFKRNQYGFTAGGPIMKDKLFFFGSFEGLNDRLATTLTASVPTAAARQGIFVSGQSVTPSPVTKPVLDLYPLPNGRITGDLGDYVYTNSRVIDEYYYVGKIDWQLDEKNSIAGRYTIDKATRSTGLSINQVTEESQTRNQYLMLEWKRIFSSQLINEARVSLNRPHDDQNPIFTSTFPAVMLYNPLALTFTGKPRYGEVTVGGGATGLGYSQRSGRIATLNRFQYIDNLSFTSGGHSLKLGFNIHRIQYNFVSPSFVAGSYAFATLPALVSGGLAQTFLGAITGMTPRGIRQVQMGFYVQDDWRMRSNLTLNLGLRYEPWTLPNEVAGRVSAFRQRTDTFMTVGNPMFTTNPSYQSFAPRVGFAWDPFGNGKTSVRAGYGLFYDQVGPVHYFNNGTLNAPFSIRVQLNNPPFPNFRSLLSNDPAQIVSSPQVISDNVKQGGVHQYQLSLQRELLRDFVLQLAYSGSHGYNLGHIIDANSALPQRDANGVYPFWPVCTTNPANACRRNSAFSQARDVAWDSAAFYNALGVTARKRFNQGYGFQLSYTFGKSIDDSSSVSVFDNGGTMNGATLFPEDVKFDRGLSWFDVRHRMVINGSLDLPFGRGRMFGSDWNGPAQQIVGGWTLNAILTAATGNRGTLNLPFNQSRSGQTTDVPDRPNVIPNGNTSPVLSDGRDPEKYFDVNQFVVGPLGYLGNVGRSTLEMPGVLFMDLSISKNWNFTEQRFLQFRAEMFNVANRTNFGGLGSSNANAIQPFSAFNVTTGVATRNINAARITRTSTTDRQIQFGLKLYF